MQVHHNWKFIMEHRDILTEFMAIMSELDALIDAGLDVDTPEGGDGPGDLVREKLDVLWWQMTAEEHDLAGVGLNSKDSKYER
jgi:hypothetical protein